MGSKSKKDPNKKTSFFSPIGKFFKDLRRMFLNGSIGTKLSYFIFGAGNFYHKRFIKGGIFLLLQVAIILFMVLCTSVN